MAIALSRRSNSDQAGDVGHKGRRETATDRLVARAGSSIAKTLDRLMIETTFFATSEKLWGGALRTFGEPLSSLAQ